MTKIFFRLYFICFVAAALSFTACSKTKKPVLQGNVYPVSNGFGYKISVNGKLLINQQSIPAFEGKLQFCDSTDARSVCNLVMDKVAHGKNPYVTKDELTKLKVKTECKGQPQTASLTN